MSKQTDRLNEVIALAEGHQRRLLEAMRSLELSIVALLREAPLQEGQLFDLEWAIQAKSKIRQEIDARYRTVVDDFVSEYAEVARKAASLLSESSSFARLDQGVMRQLQQLAFDGYSALGDDFLESVSKQIYESTLTGQTFAGAVRIVQNSVQADLARYARQAVFDGLMDFDASINTNMALEAGAERFVYFGPDDEVTRDHCDKYVGKTMTIDEIAEAWSDSWSGKREGSPFVVRGGYNCRHRFRPVFN